MAWSMSEPGYAGQRYQVSCLGFYADPEIRKVIGWTNDPTGGALVAMIDDHPFWHSPEITDMRPFTGDDQKRGESR